MMKICITGANGLLGQQLIARLLQEGHQVLASGKGPLRLPIKPDIGFEYLALDLEQPGACEDWLKTSKPDILLHAAAMTQVDECELNREKARTVNVDATKQLLTMAERYAGHFIYVSTDFVFDGSKGDYVEEDKMAPVNWYGETKKLAEEATMQSRMPWSIVRTCLVYGNPLAGTRPNLLTWVSSQLQQQHTIKVVSDQERTPTSIEDLVDGFMLLLHKGKEGIFHLAGADKLTPWDMAMATADYLKLDASLITKVDASTFSQPGRRPLKTGLNIAKARTELGYAPRPFAERLAAQFPTK
jgi:dTDP-4-dehydrorhamnose reductase